MGEIRLDIPPRLPQASVPKWAPFALGFRPFFLMAGIAAVLQLALWQAMFRGGLEAAPYYPPILWHSHEMLFGYAAAVVAGFLLTAVRNWTGVATPSGARLGFLAALWLGGRVLALIPAMPGWAIAVVDVAFAPMLTVALARPLWLGRNRINRIFIPLLLAMAVANALVHLELLGVTGLTANRGIDLQIDLVLLLLLIVTGRVVPFFTEKAVPQSHPRLVPWVERSGIVLLMVATAFRLWGGAPPVEGVLALALAAVLGWRLKGWHHPGVWRLPILWVLFAGCGWLVVGFALRGFAALGLFPPNLSVHAFTVGVIGVLTLGMMARVSLGHTGRALEVSRGTAAAFVLLNAAAAVRIFLPWLFPEAYGGWIDAAALLWMLSFALFVFAFVPVLLKARVDGRPG